MIQAVLHLHFCALLDWESHRDLIEAEEDLRDAVVEETGRMRFDSCDISEVVEMSEWLATTEEQADWIDGQECWRPNVGELEEALRRRLYDHLSDMREELPAAAE